MTHPMPSSITRPQSLISRSPQTVWPRFSVSVPVARNHLGNRNHLLGENSINRALHSTRPTTSAATIMPNRCIVPPLSSLRLSPPQPPSHSLANLRWRFHHRNPSFRHRLHLLRCRTFAARDNSSRMTHPPSRRSRLPGNKSNHRLLHISLDNLRRSLLSRPADLTNHDDRLSLWIVIQQSQRVNMSRPNNRIAPNPNRRRLPNPPRRQLVHRLIRQRPRL